MKTQTALMILVILIAGPTFAANKFECLLKTPLGSQEVRFSSLKNGKPQKKVLPGGNGGPDGLGFVELTLLETKEGSSVKAVFEGQLDGPGFSIGGVGYLFVGTPEDASVDADTISVSYQSDSVSLKCTEAN